jgi:hypothetical protein
MIHPSKNGTPNGTATAPGPHRLPTPAPDPSADPAELGDLAREMAAAFGEMVGDYRKHCELSPEEAHRRVAENSPESLDRILKAPPDEVSWFDLDTLAQEDESLALKRWAQVKAAARDQVRSGHRAARVVEDAGGPWERARYLAVRSELAAAWEPRNTAEQMLVDQLAQWQVLLWRWQEVLSAWTTCASCGPRRAKKGEPYETMRLSEAEALERAMQKVEKLHGLYLRTLKALQDLRRPRPVVAVRHSEQVNVAHQHQEVSLDGLRIALGT